MRIPLCTIAAFLLISALPATGYAGDAAVLAPIHRFVDSVNKGDTQGADSAYAPGAVIIDDLAPYLFRGDDAFGQWYGDLKTRVKKAGVTGPAFTLMAPRSVEVAGDRAYAVIPARIDFKKDGRIVGGETGTFTFAVIKTAAGWRIAAWAWARRAHSK